MMNELLDPYTVMQDADVAPTAQGVAAAEAALATFEGLRAKWNALKPKVGG
jgi:hypothetical protein